LEIQQRMLKFITMSNWALFIIAGVGGLIIAPADFAKGIIFGGLIVTINFHLLYRTLKKAFTPPRISSHNIVLAKYYLRFAFSGVILFFLISKHIVNPLGLFIGLSIVVASIVASTIVEFTKLIFIKEAV